jgi:hypothetical protein
MHSFPALSRRAVVLLTTAVLVGTAAASVPFVARSSTPNATAKPSLASAATATPIVLADDTLPALRTGVLDVVDDPTALILSTVEAAGGVPRATGRCAPDAVRLSYEEPGDGWKAGAHVSPLVAPDALGTAVSGIALCDGEHFGYVGFEAIHDASGWTVQLVPDPAGGLDGDEEHADNTLQNDPAPAKSQIAVSPDSPLVGLVDGPSIEGYAAYEGQSTCDPTAKPGTVALRNLLLARYPMSKSLGITRACASGGKSEHKEGRALDWGVNVNNAAQKAAAEDFIADLLATDQYGHAHALVRRMGIMYIIWNGRIWSAYQAGAGWRTYTGSSPHTDHVHLSLSWAGARAETSFWSGTVVPGLPDRPLGSGSSSGRGSSTTTRHIRTTTSTADAATTSTTAPRRRWSPTSTTIAETDQATTTTYRRRTSSTTSSTSSTSTTVRQWTTTTTAPRVTTTTAPRVTTTTAPRVTTTTAPRVTTTTAPRWWATTTTSAPRATTTTTAPKATTTTTAAVTTTTAAG